SRRRHTRCYRDWSSDVCSSDLIRSHKPGDKLDLKIKSGEQSRDVALTLADRSPAATTRPSFGNLGGQIENVQDEQGPNSHEYGEIGRASCRERGKGWVGR